MESDLGESILLPHSFNVMTDTAWCCSDIFWIASNISIATVAYLKKLCVRICERTVAGCGKRDPPSPSPAQAWGRSFSVALCCWTVDFFVRDSGRISSDGPIDLTSRTFSGASPSEPLYVLLALTLTVALHRSAPLILSDASTGAPDSTALLKELIRDNYCVS